MYMAADSICIRRVHEGIGLAWPSARLIVLGPGRCKPHRSGIDTCRVSAGAFSLPERDFSIPAVTALSFVLGRMPRESQRISSDFAQARWDLRFLVIPSSVEPEE